MKLSAPFIGRPVATTLLTIGIALAGILAISRLPVSAPPQVVFPTISVQAQLPGAGLASTSNFSSASGSSRTFVTNVENSAVNRWACEACNPRHQADAAATKRQRFGSRKAPSTLLVQNRSDLFIPLAYRALLRGPNHSVKLR